MTLGKPLSRISGFTLTIPSRSRCLLTLSVIQTRTRRARIRGDLTVWASKAWQTIACVTSNHVTTQAVVLARLWQIYALVDVDLAVRTRPAVSTSAIVATCVLAARAAVETRRTLTYVVERLAVLSGPAFIFEID